MKILLPNQTWNFWAWGLVPLPRLYQLHYLPLCLSTRGLKVENLWFRVQSLTCDCNNCTICHCASLSDAAASADLLLSMLCASALASCCALCPPLSPMPPLTSSSSNRGDDDPELTGSRRKLWAAMPPPHSGAGSSEVLSWETSVSVMSGSNPLEPSDVAGDL